ncbi:MAG: phage structural protein [Oscillospiraceae bacterium]|jgi:hypothetical protein
MIVATYDAKDASVMVDNTYITGLGEDMISAEKDEDFFSPSVGAQGDVIKSQINNPLGQVTIYVQPTSPQKAFLMDLAKRRDPFPLWCINKALGERVGGTMANLLTFPSIERGAEAEDMEFVFQVFDLTIESA